VEILYKRKPTATAPRIAAKIAEQRTIFPTLTFLLKNKKLNVKAGIKIITNEMENKYTMRMICGKPNSIKAVYQIFWSVIK